ncbi:MAG: DUF1820 family protein [Candidatus Sedimenticola sp. (ex Thyasira tokunagai)]
MRIFRISFINQSRVYEIYADTVRQANLPGFIEFEGVIFGENSSLVIDPGEEKLKSEFSGVSRTMIPLHAVIRIDEVEKRGQSKIVELDANANVTPFPPPGYKPE